MSANSIRVGGPSCRGIGLALGFALVASSFLVGCATPPKEPEARAAYEEANDPLEPTNRAIFSANLAVDDAVIKPTAKAYREVPDPIRKSLHNMMENARSPVLFANYVLQGELGHAAETLMRFVYNTVAGVGGAFDVAGSTGLPLRDTDFGVTLAKWGISEGPYVMLPLLGPSNPRDTVGLVADGFLDPIGYFATFGESLGRFAAEGIDKREPNIEPLDEIRRTSVDFYATLRSLYRQRRQNQIHTGTPGNIPAPSISENINIKDDDPLIARRAQVPPVNETTSQGPN